MDLISLHDHPEYIPVLAQWFHKQWGYLHPERPMDAVIEELKIPANTLGLPFIYVLIENKQPIGTASLITQDMPDYNQAQLWTPWLASVFVSSEYRRKGVGERLLKAIDTKAVELGFQKIYLFTPDQAPWYVKHGWQVLEEIEYHDDQVTIMIKDLSN